MVPLIRESIKEPFRNNMVISTAARNVSDGLLWWREKMHNASTAADCAEMQRLSKIGCFLHFGETGDSPDTFIFYFQHNNNPVLMLGMGYS